MSKEKIFKPLTLRQFRSKYHRFELRIFEKNGKQFYPTTREREKEIFLDSYNYIVVMYMKMTKDKLAVCVQEDKDL